MDMREGIFMIVAQENRNAKLVALYNNDFKQKIASAIALQGISITLR